jgi:hypothetical protein
MSARNGFGHVRVFAARTGGLKRSHALALLGRIDKRAQQTAVLGPSQTQAHRRTPDGEGGLGAPVVHRMTERAQQGGPILRARDGDEPSGEEGGGIDAGGGDAIGRADPAFARERQQQAGLFPQQTLQRFSRPSVRLGLVGRSPQPPRQPAAQPGGHDRQRRRSQGDPDHPAGSVQRRPRHLRQRHRRDRRERQRGASRHARPRPDGDDERREAKRSRGSAQAAARGRSNPARHRGDGQCGEPCGVALRRLRRRRTHEAPDRLSRRG